MLRVFPIEDVPGIHFWDDFGTPRNNGRTHQGNDLFAPEGSTVVAPDDGTVSYYVDGIGGPSFVLKADDGSKYYGTHLSGYIGDARHVQAGDAIARVGHAGNAAGTEPHLHFQLWLPSGALVDPYPYVSRAPRVSPQAVASSTSVDATRLLAAAAVMALAGGAIYAYRSGALRLPRLV